MTPWERATLALHLLRVDPDALGGIVIHARSGPVRDRFLAELPHDAVRLHPAMGQETLTGGIDVANSLAEGMLVRQSGLLDTNDTMFVLSMAERAPALLASNIASLLDHQYGNCIIALDERTEDETPPPAALLDRLAFHVSLDGLSIREASGHATGAASSALSCVDTPEYVIEDIVALAVSLGIHSLRAPSLALAAAKANAALNKRNCVAPEDVIVAAELVLAPRATQLPQEMEDNGAETPPEPEQENAEQSQPAENLIPQDILLKAILTALPPDLLSKTGSNPPKGSVGSGAGSKRIGNRRGRPLTPRDTGAKSSDARVDLIATLRAAIPWQKLRKAARPDRTGPIIFPNDLRYKRYEDLSDRLLIFAVDASGSAALARLSEAKGAVELLLAEAYARRDHVALISFRGDTAETLLPSTRSLVQTKRRLAELAGGGGTPLASGLKCSLEAAFVAMRKGFSPVIVLLTDGRSNVALDGSANRVRAAQDAVDIARQIAHHRIDTIVIDTGKRPEHALRDLSLSLRGQYASLPRADAQSLSQTVSSALGT